MSKIEVVWNYHGPRWRGREEVAKIREEDTDWRRWLMGRAARPFDPRLYFEFRLYKEFSGGIADQWMSHGIDLVHWFMGDSFPRSVVAHGGVFAWHDGRENADTFQALLEYPKGFLVSYSTSFGNDAPSSTRYMGKKATLLNIGGEGSPRYQIIEEKGNHEDDSNIDAQRAAKYVQLPGDDRRAPHGDRRPDPGAHGQLVRVHAVSTTHPRHGRRRLRPLCGVHHGGAVLLVREEALLGRRQGGDPRSPAHRGLGRGRPQGVTDRSAWSEAVESPPAHTSNASASWTHRREAVLQ